jgi:hypothetical protein
VSKYRIAYDGKVHVLAERCSTCIFKPGNLMSLQPGRVRDMIEACRRDEGTIPCHKTLDEEAQAVCRGFYEAAISWHSLLQMAERLGVIEEVILPSP